jgi:heat shock protein HslJ
MGFAGCNRIFGKYELTEGNHVSFSGVASTLMACPEMEMEEKVKKALEMVDNYSINGNQLMLAKARMAPLARFEAVYLK